MTTDHTEICTWSMPLNGQGIAPTGNAPWQWQIQTCVGTTTSNFASDTITIANENTIIMGGVFILVFTFFVFVTMFSDLKKYG